MCLITYINNHGHLLLSSSYVTGMLLNALYVLPHLSLPTSLVDLLLSLISSKETDLWIHQDVSGSRTSQYPNRWTRNPIYHHSQLSLSKSNNKTTLFALTQQPLALFSLCIWSQIRSHTLQSCEFQGKPSLSLAPVEVGMVNPDWFKRIQRPLTNCLFEAWPSHAVQSSETWAAFLFLSFFFNLYVSLALLPECLNLGSSPTICWHSGFRQVY